MRNLGGAIGIAAGQHVWLHDHARIHAARLGEALGRQPGRATRAHFVACDSPRMASIDPRSRAMRWLMAQGELVGRLVGREALTIAFDEVFRTDSRGCSSPRW